MHSHKYTHIFRTVSVILSSLIGLALLALTVMVSKNMMHALWLRLAYEWVSPFTVDTTMYWAVGRGIASGLMPYRDLFEVKPPGIFLLSAFSVWLKGNMSLTGVMQSAVLALMPIALVLGTLRIVRHRWHLYAVIAVMLASVFGMMLALYSEDRSGEFQVESFGAAFILLYAAILVWRKTPLTRGRILLCSLALYGGIGMKEPFLIVAFAVALLLAEKPTDLIRSFVIPVCITAAAGLVSIWLLGYGHAYFHMYLPEVLGRNIVDGPPLWQRGFFVAQTYQDLADYMPALAWMIVFLMYALFLRVRDAAHDGHMLFVMACTGIACYLLILTIGIRGTYWNHHFVFAVPGYGAMFFVFIRELERHWKRWTAFTGLMGLGAMTLLASTQIPSFDLDARVSYIQGEQAAVQESADYIDAVLDACSIDRYMFLGGNGAQPYGFTKHSPIGPMFVQFEEWMESDRPEFREAMLRQMDEATFVVKDTMNLNWLNVPVNRTLEQYFTEEPWPCAANIPKNDRYRYLFRFARPSIPLTESAQNLIF